MIRNNYLPFKLRNLLSMTLKSIILLIGLNIIFTTIIIAIKEKIQDNLHIETSHFYLKDVKTNLKNLS